MAERGQARWGTAAAVPGLAALFGAGCGTGRLSPQAQETAPRTATKSGLATGSPRRALGARYLVIAGAGNRRLNADFDPLETRDANDLVRAKADLADAAAAERLFHRRLHRLNFAAQYGRR